MLQTVPVLDHCHVHFSPMNVLYGISLDSDRDEFDDPPYYETSFKVLDSYDYSSITTIDVKRNIYDMSVNGDGSLIALVENQPGYDTKDETIVKLYAVGMKKLEHLDEVRQSSCVHNETQLERNTVPAGSGGGGNDVVGANSNNLRNSSAAAASGLNNQNINNINNDVAIADDDNDDENDVNVFLMAGEAAAPVEGGGGGAININHEYAENIRVGALNNNLNEQVRLLRGHLESRNRNPNNPYLYANANHARRNRLQQQHRNSGNAAASRSGRAANAGAVAEFGDMRIHDDDELNELALSIFAMLTGRR